MFCDRTGVVKAFFLAGCLMAGSLSGGLAWAEDGVTATTIKIGAFGPLTGSSSMYGYPINNGAFAVYKDINDQGGINGRKIEIVHEDDGCDPAKARAAVKKLIHSEKVFMVHGGSCSGAVVATRDEYIDNKVPFVVMAAALDRISVPTNRYIFTTMLPASVDAVVMFEFAKSKPNLKRVAIVKHANEWADSRVIGLTKAIKDAGLLLVADVTVEPKATDATSQVLKLKEAAPDAIFSILYPGESAIFLRDANKYGLKGPFISTTGTMDLLDLAERSGNAAAAKEFYTVSFMRSPIGAPDVQKYTDVYKKYFPNDKLQTLSFYGMSGAFTIIDALRRAGPDLTREKFIAAMETTKDGNAGPAACKVNLSKDRHQGCLEGTIWGLRDGKIVNIGMTYPKN